MICPIEQRQFRLCLDSKDGGSTIDGRKPLIVAPLQSYQSWICSGKSSASTSAEGEPWMT